MKNINITPSKLIPAIESPVCSFLGLIIEEMLAIAAEPQIAFPIPINNAVEFAIPINLPINKDDNIEIKIRTEININILKLINFNIDNSKPAPIKIMAIFNIFFSAKLENKFTSLGKSKN